MRDKIIGDPPIGSEFDSANTNKKEEFDGKIPPENFHVQYTEDDLNKILTRQKHIIDALKKHNQPKYLADRLLLIFDDLVGSALFGQAQDNLFKLRIIFQDLYLGIQHKTSRKIINFIYEIALFR